MARDLAIGRIYLPRKDRDRFGYPEPDLRALRFTPQFRDLMEFEVDRTRRLFEEGRPLVARIPGEMAVDVDLFSRGGLAILDAIERQGYDVLTSRPSLSADSLTRAPPKTRLTISMATAVTIADQTTAMATAWSWIRNWLPIE